MPAAPGSLVHYYKHTHQCRPWASFHDLTCLFAAADGGRPFEVVQEMGHQLANMAMLYVLIGLLNKRARTAGNNAARQVCALLISILFTGYFCNISSPQVIYLFN